MKMNKIYEKIEDRSIFKWLNIFLIIIPIIIVMLSLLNYEYKATIWYNLILFSGNIGLVCSLYYIYKNKIKKIKKRDFIPLILLLIFLIWTIITSLMSDNIYLTLTGSSYRKEGILTYICYAGLLLTGILTKNKDKKIFYNLFIIVGVILSIYMFFKCGFSFTNSVTKYRSIFHQFNHFGYFLFMSIICSLNMFMNMENKKLKILYLISFVILVKVLVINDTLGSFLAVFGTIVLLFIYYFFINKKRKSFIILLIAFTLASVNLKGIENNIFKELKSNVISALKVDLKDTKQVNNLGTGRGQLWRCSITLIKEKPIMGYGLDNIENRMYKLGCSNDRPHNDILQLSVFTGIPGMIIYMSAIILILIILFKNIRILNYETITSYSIVIAYLISSLTANSMYYTTPYYMIFLGFTINFIYEKYLKNTTK